MKTLLLLLFFFSSSLQGAEKYKNKNCQINLTVGQKKSISYAFDDIKRLVNEKKYELISLEKTLQYKIGPNQDYFIFDVKKTGGVFSPCLAKLKIMRTKGLFISEIDKPIWKSEGRRRLPRTTLNGNVRCLYAIKDALAALPICK